MFKTMCIGLVAVLAAAGIASAATIGFGQASYSFPTNSGQHTINVMITGTEQIASTDVYLFLGDGGGDVGGSDTSPPMPRFVDLQIAAAGNVFSNTDAQGPLTLFPLAAVRSGITASGTRLANGTLAQLVIDTTGIPQGGPYTLSLQNASLGFATGVLLGSGAPADVQLSGATVTITPEPAAAMLLIGALPFLRRRSVA